MSDPLSPLQFQHEKTDYGWHRIRALTSAGTEAGEMMWDNRRIRGITTAPGFERQGVATSMWHEGHRLAAENQRVPKPKHSADRTDEGDAWARSVGGSLPRRRQ